MPGLHEKAGGPDQSRLSIIFITTLSKYGIF